MKTQRALLALTLWLTACAPVTTTPYPAPPTTGYPAPATPTAAPSALPTTPAPPTETPAPTATAKPEVWEIWFHGYFCGEGASICDGPGYESKYYSILSDGSGLKEIKAFEFPFASRLNLPPNAPPPLPHGMSAPPQYSPDGSRVLYVDSEWKLRNVELATGQSIQLFDAMPFPSNVGPFCWISQEQIVFSEFGKGRELTPPIVYSIKSDGSNLQELYRLPGLESLQYSDCAPTRDEAVLSVSGAPPVVGLYVLNLMNGQVRQVLSSYMAGVVIAAPGQK
jgi:hypothetical protein